jgi:hypothetical protein
MRRAIALLTSAACTAALALVAAPATRAGDTGRTDDLSGRWQSATLKMDGLGWALTLRPATVGSGYLAVFQFQDQDGSPGATVRARVTSDGNRVVLVLNGEPGQRTVLRGSVGMDGYLFFPTCYRLFTLTSKPMADENCLFQELPS